MRHISILFVLLLFSFSTFSQTNKKLNKINGVSFVAPPREIEKASLLKPKEKVNANYLSFMPYGYIPDGGTKLVFDSDRQWWGEKRQGTIDMIRTAKSEGYKIMLKPHVWKGHGEFTGNHTYSNNSEWEEFESSYTAYILAFAKIAEQEKVDLFCIGTEWGKFVEQRPQFWKELIEKVKNTYSGKLTYAANWDEYRKVSFWKELDFIGVDAYFPLTEVKTPNKDQISKALRKPMNELRTMSQTYGRPILFTEFGYRSRDYTAFKPWESDRVGEANLEGQINAYEGFFESLWRQDFIAGGFVWKWFANYERSGGEAHNGYTPQNKPVEKTIFKWFSN